MPKLKTNRAARKRFKITGSGRAKRAQAGKRHGMIEKPRSRKRRLLRPIMVADADQARVLRMLGRR